MLHVIIKYTEVVTNLDLIKVTTMPLEFRGGIEVKSDIQTKYSAYVGSEIDGFRKTMNLDAIGECLLQTKI